MTKNVFAGMWEIAAENGMNKSIARFPDVCMSPPSPPAGPIPIPYPDTSFSNNLKSGSSTVKIGGEGAALAQKSYYKESVLGDEAATRTFGANVVTHQITGKTFFQAWCMDVKFEDKNVCRHFDITTSNHASSGTTTAPLPAIEFQNLADAQEVIDAGICPCCGEALHEWQKDPATGRPFRAVTSTQFWQSRIDRLPPGPGQTALYETLKDFTLAKQQARAARDAGGAGCNNVHPSNTSGCAIHFEIPSGVRYPPRGSSGPRTVAQVCDDAFGRRAKARVDRQWASKPTTRPAMTSRNHMTPKQAGGCNDPDNVVPDNKMGGPECDDIEALQTTLEQETRSLI
ncbi:MAG: DUF4150 domain-containing protein [Mesorhizobium sp.]|nr:MAG: DUF4150 domain-containing protein [Mesorhizobium sp.]